MIRFATLENISLSQLLETFNRAFSDYLVPMSLTEEQLAQKIKVENIDLQYSVGAFHQEELIGFILHATGQSYWAHWLYNGGTGVIPHYRNLGLTQKMYAFILPTLKKEQFKKILLEVIDLNSPALISYERVGFQPKRNLLCFKGNVGKIALKTDAEIHPMFHLNWEIINSCWSIKPTWQNQISAIEKQKNNLCILGAYLQENWVGYCIFNPINKRIIQIGVLPEFRRLGIGKALIFHVSENFGPILSINNVDASHRETVEFFNSIGLKNQVNQIECEYTFS